MDTGYKQPYWNEIAPATTGKGEKKKPAPTVYPELCIEDKPAFAEAMQVGREFTATIRVKCTGINVNQGSRRDFGPKDRCSVTLEVTDIDSEDVDIPDEDEGKEESASEAMGKFFVDKDKD